MSSWQSLTPLQKQDRICTELKETEKMYSENLSQLTTVLKQVSESHPQHLTKEVSEFIEAYSQIADIHKEIYEIWKQGLMEQILQSFEDFKVRLEVAYSEYLTKFVETETVLEFKWIKKNKDLISQLLLEASGRADLRLEVYLILPRARIPRYVLIVREISKTCGTSDELFGKVSSVEKSLRSIAEDINNSVSCYEKKMKMLAEFVDKKRPSPEVMEQRLIWDSALWKKCADEQVLLHYWLFESVLVIARQNNYGKFELLHQEPINSIWKAEEKEDDTTAFFLSMGYRKDLLRAEDSELMVSWIDHLKKQIANCGDGSDQKEQSLKICNVCEVCEKEFGLMKKKEECFTCYRIVHKECSSFIPITSPDPNAPSRVCKMHSS
jgi:hypothetical protein